MSLIINNLVEEVWKQVPGYEGIYSVSNLGRIRREVAYRNHWYKRDGILTPWISSKKRLLVELYKNQTSITFSVHKLVMLTFIGECPSGFEINHKDGNPQNNYLENLEYVTPEENQKHAIINKFHIFGERHGMSKLTEQQVLAIRKDSRSLKEISREYGVAISTVSDIRIKRTWAHL
jgi:hypothetical protein